MDRRGECRKDAFPSSKDAAAQGRRIQLAMRVRVTPAYCGTCDAFHNLADLKGRGVGDEERKIMLALANGLTYQEIAEDMGFKRERVRRIAERLSWTFGATSIANLVAIAVWFGIIEIADIIPKELPHGC